MYKLPENLKRSNVVCYYFVTVEPLSLNSSVAGAFVFREKEETWPQKHLNTAKLWTFWSMKYLRIV